jgi:hypothetical protein
MLKKLIYCKIHTAHNLRTNKNIEKANIKINGEDVPVTPIGKLLGVKLTDTFNWKPQCDGVASKLKSTAYIASQCSRATVTLPSLLKVYFADVQSHILYTNVIWGGSPLMQQVFTAQKRCVLEPYVREKILEGALCSPLL